MQDPVPVGYVCDKAKCTMLKVVLPRPSILLGEFVYKGDAYDGFMKGEGQLFNIRCT